MKDEHIEQMRTACRALGKRGRSFTNAMLYEALGAGRDDQKRRDRIRKRCNDLMKSGELKRVGRGEYEYVAEAAPRRDAPLLNNAWRAIKAAKPGFSVNDITKRSGATHSHVCRWFRHLENEEYIKRTGRDGNVILYRATKLAKETSDTPLPPKELRDPFADERDAVCELVQLFMVGNPYQPGTQEKIMKHCRTIMDRFEKQEEA